MIIDKIDLYKVPPRWVFIKITTSSGITGWGEPIVEGKADSLIAIVRELEPYLLGRNAHQVEDIFQVLSKGGFYRGGILLMSAISGIEQALWDIKGKALGVPVFELLGGAVRDKMRLYSWVGGDSRENLLAQTQARMDAGYTAVKLNIAGHLESALSRQKLTEIQSDIRAVRKILGDQNELAIDFHGRIHKSQVKRVMREFEEFTPMFYEEPLLPEHSRYFKDISMSTHVPIATGERLSGKQAFVELIWYAGVDILQPDLSHVGGILEAKKIAAWSETAGITIAPHCPLGPIAFASCLQFDFCTPNVLIQETSMDIHYNGNGINMHTYILNKEDFVIQEGYISRSQKPGLGIEIDENMVTKMAKITHNWKNPIWRNRDGSFSEW